MAVRISRELIDPSATIYSLELALDRRAKPERYSENDLPETSASKVDFFSALSDEIGIEILSYLGPDDLANCSKISRRWHRLACDNSLWRAFIPAVPIPENEQNVKAYIGRVGLRTAKKLSLPQDIASRIYQQLLSGKEYHLTFLRNPKCYMSIKLEREGESSYEKINSIFVSRLSNPTEKNERRDGENQLHLAVSLLDSNNQRVKLSSNQCLPEAFGYSEEHLNKNIFLGVAKFLREVFVTQRSLKGSNLDFFGAA